MQNPMGFTHFLSQADDVTRFVLALMVLASVGTWYLIISKGVRAWRRHGRTRAFLAEFWDAPNLEAVASRIREQGADEPFAHMVHHGFTAIGHCNHPRTGKARQVLRLVDRGASDELLTRALKRAIDEDRARLEFGQAFLATVASAAPFIGLFGTVWGIYHALIAIGISGQGTLDKVAGPVGEALIMTALGLAIAIPAAIGYNAFARINRNTLNQLNSFAHDVLTFLSTGVKTSPMRTDARESSQRVLELVRAGVNHDSETVMAKEI